MKRSEVYVPLTLLPLWNTISSFLILTSDLDSFRLKKGKCAMKHGKMISIFIILAILLGTVPALALDIPAQAPQIVETVYPTEDVVVADIVATQAPYSADPTGERDCTAVLQRAVDDCAANGGGTVFLPVGRYLVTGNIYIKPFVTLRGDWQDPDTGTDYGTVIIARPESADAKGPALFDVGASGGAVGLTVWYPDQSLDSVRPYPFTFYVNGKRDYMLHTLHNITLLNSYRGVGLCSLCEDGVYQCHELTTIDNVKGTCLLEGLNAWNCADVDVYKTVYFDNQYWLAAGEAFHAPDRGQLDAYTRANATGMLLADLEWPEIADIRISSCRYGIRLVKGIRVQFNASFYKTEIRNCDYAYYAEEDAVWARGANWGVSFAQSVLEGSKFAAYYTGDAILEFHNVSVKGAVRVRHLQKTFSSPIELTLDKTSARPAPVLYVVQADRSGRTDTSAAVQEKLTEAAATGGVVYLPGGLYRFEAPVTVPAGVELRGSSCVASRDQSGNSSGTLILSFYGYGEADSPPVTLAGDGAGVRGLRFDYPENAPVEGSASYRETSPCIASQANDVYVVNSYVTLAAVGVKLDGCRRAFVKRLVGCCYGSMLKLDHCEAPWIEATLQNGNAVTRNGYADIDLPELQGRLKESRIFDVLFDPILKQTCTYLEINNCEDAAVFNTFIYGAKHYLHAADSSLTLVNIGYDGNNGSEPALELSGGSVTVLNSMRCEGKMYVIENETAYRSYNSMLIFGACKEYCVMKNLSFAQLDAPERLQLMLQPLYRVLAFFEKLIFNLVH